MDFNAVCPKCQGLIYLDTNEEASVCPKCGKPIYVPRAVMIFEDSFASKGDEAYEKPKTVAPPVRGENNILSSTATNVPLPSVGSVKKGDIITFGSYEQGKGKTPIEWYVLDVQGGYAFIMSRYALDCKPYHTADIPVTWRDSQLRSWLNSEFVSEAFTDAERQKILKNIYKAHKNPKFSFDCGEDTMDEVSLISMQEAEKCFKNTNYFACVSTPYAKANGGYVYDKTGNSWWWMRTVGSQKNKACGGLTTGAPDYTGAHASCGDCVVRPVLWLKIN